jgi:hypothetical protein
MVSRLDHGQGQALAQVRARLAAARSAARSLGVSCWVDFIAGTGREAGETFLRATRLAPLLSLSFTGTGESRYGLRPTFLGGEIRAGGRFGNALAHPAEGEHALTVATAGRAYMTLERGFLVRCDCRVESHRRMVLFRWGESMELGLGPGGEPLGKVTLAGREGLPGRRLELAGPDPLPLGSWVTLELHFDAKGAGRVFQRPGETILVSDGGRPVAGLLDEIRLYSLDFEEPETIPGQVELVEGPARVQFDPRGALDPEVHTGALVLRFALGADRIREIRISRLGVVQ